MKGISKEYKIDGSFLHVSSVILGDLKMIPLILRIIFKKEDFKGHGWT